MSDATVTRPAFEAAVQRVTVSHRQPVVLPALLTFDPDDQFAAQRLAELMERDPLMSRRVYEGFVRQGDSRQAAFTARDAIQRAGVAGIRCNVATCGIAHSLKAPEVAGFGAYWQHVLAAGLLASLMGSALRLDYLQCFVAGALQDVGRWLLIVHEPDAARLVLDTAMTSGEPIEEIEQRHLGYRTRDLGLALAEAWELPAPITAVFAAGESGAGEDTPASAARRGLVAAVRYGYANPLAPPVDPGALPVDAHLDNVLRKFGGVERLHQGVNSLMGAAQIAE